MTTKELIKKLENKSAFSLAWSVMWRMWILVLGFYAVAFLLGFFGAIMLSL
jgi:hypothetical protein